MAQSLIGETVHVCNCGPGCKCGYWSHEESACSCGRPTAERTILAEDAGGFYVSQTGAGLEASEELGAAPFTASNGLPLQRFPVERDEQGEAMGMAHHRSTTTASTSRISREPTGRTSSSSGAQSGTVLGVAWSFQMGPDGRGMLRLGDREVHVERLGTQLTTHALTGAWPNIASIAENLLLFHPNFSPLARRREPPLVS